MSELVGLTVVANEAEAELMINLLGTEGIESIRRPTTFSAMTVSGGRQEILVREEDLERARELIDGD